MSTKTLLRTEPELSNNSVLMIYRERLRYSAFTLDVVCLYYKICRIKISIKCVYIPP